VEILYFKDYAHILLQHHLTDLARQELICKRELGQPLLKNLAHLSDDQLVMFIQDNLKEFLEDILKGREFGIIDQGSYEKSSGHLAELNRPELSAMDIVVEYGARKKALLGFLPKFTNNYDLALNIINEIVSLYTIKEKNAIEVYMAVKKAEKEEIIRSQQEAEVKLRLNENRLKESQRMASLGNWEMDPRSGFSIWSEELYRIFGLPYNTVISMDKITAMMSKETSEKVINNINKGFDLGLPYIHEYEINRPDGKRRILRTHGVPEFDENGRVKFLKGITQDITQLKETENLLRQSQELITQIARLAPMIVLVIGVPDNKLIYYNENIFENLTLSREEVQKKGYRSFWEIVHPDDLNAVIKRNKTYVTLKDDDKSILELRLKGKSGDWRWYYSRSVVFKRDEKGEVMEILFVALDINDLKVAEVTVMQNNKFIQKLTETIPNILYIYDIRGQRNVYSNRTVGDVLGYTPEEIIALGSNVLTTFIHPEDAPKVAGMFNDFVSAKEGEIRKQVYRMRDARGKWSWFVSMNTVFDRDEYGFPYQVLGVVQDITDRVETEDALKYSEAQLVEAQKIGHVGSFDWNIESNIIQGSEEFFKIYGLNYNNGKVPFDKIMSLILEEDRQKVYNHIQDAFHLDGIMDIDFRIVVNKTIQYLISRAKFYKDEMGKPVRLVGAVLDVTRIKLVEEALQRKNDELVRAYENLKKAKNELRDSNIVLEKRVRERTAELEESDEKYKAFVAQSQEGILRYELHNNEGIDITMPVDDQVREILDHGYIAECNDRIAQMYGYHSSEDFMGKSISSILDVSDERILKIIKSFITSEYKLENLQTHGSGPDNSIRYYSSNILGIVEKGKLIRAWSTQIDVTTARIAEKEMRASEEKYRFLAETVPQLFWTGTKEGHIEYYNQNWYLYTGQQFDTDEKWSWLNVVAEKDKKACSQKLEESMQTGEMFEIECRLKKYDGSYGWYLARALPLTEGGGIKKWFGTFTDINERKLIEENLRIKNEELIKINLDLDNFIYTASHDLKAPISNIEGLLQTINDTLDPEHCKSEEMTMLFDMMDQSILRFKRTIHDLTEITRAQKSSEEDDEYVEFKAIFEDVVTSIYDLVSVTQATFTLDFSVPSIKFSRKSMRSIFYNLISNALKYRSPDRKPEVILKTEKHDEWIVFSITDNGLGISDANKEKVFSMFKRLHDHVEGSGVGLYIVKRIVTNAGGRIELESNVDSGTTFRIFFKSEPVL